MCLWPLQQRPLSSVSMLLFILDPKPHTSETRVPPPLTGSPLKFQNKPRWKHREEGGTYLAPSLEREGDYEGLWPSLILHFSSPQHLLSASVSCQNSACFHPKTVCSCCDHENVTQQLIQVHSFISLSFTSNDFSSLSTLSGMFLLQ